MEKFFVEGRPLLLAHRGASGFAPELTLAAFSLALEQGADGMEVDVQLSGDGHVIVMHDDTLKRTTGAQGRVLDYNWPELQTLDAGKWFDPAFSGEGIPDLEQVMIFGPPGWRLNIELKSSPHPEKLVQQVAGLVRCEKTPERIICTSFNPEILYELAGILPQIPTGLIFSGSWPEPNTLYHWPLWSVEKSLLSPDRLQEAREHNIKVCVWTVNQVEEIENLILAGVDAIITNYPDRFYHALANLERMAKK